MPDLDTLLPSNASQLERALAGAMDPIDRLQNAGSLLRTGKRNNIPESVIPFLLYEYGLGELLPYLKDPRTAISTGVLWQRLRGTPESFKIALSWINNDGQIEESEQGQITWGQFQLGLTNPPDDLSQTDSVVELARLSSPVRSSLFRIYGGWYDGRRFKLDEHMLSGMDTLCDHTGVRLSSDPDAPQLSFGRLTEQRWQFTTSEAEFAIHRYIPNELTYEDRFILDQSKLSEWWHLLEQMQMSASRGHFIIEAAKPARPSRTWTDSPQQTWSSALTWATDFAGNRLKFAKAGIYLGDGAKLGELNACLPAKYQIEEGDGPLLLSEFDPTQAEQGFALSGHVMRPVDIEINERDERFKQGGSLYVGQYQGHTEIFPLTHGEAYTGNNNTAAPPHVTRVTSFRSQNYSINGRLDASNTIFGDGAGHQLGDGEDFFPAAKTWQGNPVHVDETSVEIIEPNAEFPRGLIRAAEAHLVQGGGGYWVSYYWTLSGNFITADLYNDAGARRETTFIGSAATAGSQVFRPLYIGAPVRLTKKRTHVIDEHVFTVGIADASHRRHVEEFTQPEDISTWSNAHTWASGNGWRDLFRELSTTRFHAVETAGDGASAGTLTLSSRSVTALTHDALALASTTHRTHVKTLTAPGSTIPTGWTAASTWQGAGDWLATFDDNHVESLHSIVDSNADAAVLAFNASGVAIRGRVHVTAFTGPAEAIEASQASASVALLAYTSDGEAWSAEITWQEAEAWAGVFPITSASFTHHATEHVYSGFSTRSNALPATIQTTAVQLYNSGSNTSIYVRHNAADIADVQVGSRFVEYDANGSTVPIPFLITVTKVWDGVNLGWLSLSAAGYPRPNNIYTYETDVPAALDTETGAATYDAVEIEFTHPDYFANPQSWASTLGAWEDQSTWSPVASARGSDHAVSLSFPLAVEATNATSTVAFGSEIAYNNATAETAISRRYIKRAFIPFFRDEEIWRADATWGQVYGWATFTQPETSRTRLRREVASLTYESVSTTLAQYGHARSTVSTAFPDDIFALDEHARLSTDWHFPDHSFLYRTTNRVSVAYYPRNASGWASLLPWEGVWAWTDTFGDPISQHRQDN